MSVKETSISLVVALSAITVFFVGWNGWLSMKVIASGEENATILERQANITKEIDDFRDEVKTSFKFVNEKIDIIAPRVGVETRSLVMSTTT